jgi:hypothetical protein
LIMALLSDAERDAIARRRAPVEGRRPRLAGTARDPPG